MSLDIVNCPMGDTHPLPSREQVSQHHQASRDSAYSGSSTLFCYFPKSREDEQVFWEYHGSDILKGHKHFRKNKQH